MNPPCSFCLLLLLSLGACFPPDGGLQTSRRFAEKGLAGTEEQPGLRVADSPKWKRSAEDLRSLFSIAKELQSFGKEKAGIQFRFGRDREGENEAVNYLPEKDGVKWGDTLGSLAEELNGYNRKKGGFSFRFGRRATQF
ncbi:orexigenic neuropeptide QRFP [Sphaerodactylus townsendi]|uniref:orexigenic neuropeptide QRFP n=1 Tax=Sphaerodactylus townsendi TaxID=933632 RepID=UPI0020273B78|nr:orexigenic neuropeptide QRFP [Sphaerodactylus townsendi]